MALPHGLQRRSKDSRRNNPIYCGFDSSDESDITNDEIQDQDVRNTDILENAGNDIQQPVIPAVIPANADNDIQEPVIPVVNQVEANIPARTRAIASVENHIDKYIKKKVSRNPQFYIPGPSQIGGKCENVFTNNPIFD